MSINFKRFYFLPLWIFHFSYIHSLNNILQISKRGDIQTQTDSHRERDIHGINMAEAIIADRTIT